MLFNKYSTSRTANLDDFNQKSHSCHQLVIIKPHSCAIVTMGRTASRGPPSPVLRRVQMPNPTAQDVMAGLMAILGDKAHPSHNCVMAALRTVGNPRLGLRQPRKRSVPDTGPVVARYFDRRGARTQPGLAPTCDTCASPKTADERPWPTYRGMVLCPECRQEAEDHFRVALDARRQWAGCEFTQLISDDQ